MLLNRVKILLAFLLSMSICYFIAFGAKKSEVIVLNEARSSFVKIIVENEVLITDCSDIEIMQGMCDGSSLSSQDYQITGSGIIINHKNDSYILSVDHICTQMIEGQVYGEDGTTGIRLSSHSAMTLDGILHRVEIVKRDEKNDLCLLEFERNEEYVGINVYENNLIPGERVYNLAAPRGVFEPGNVLIFEGFFTGTTMSVNNSSMFSIYAEQGSSGSAIINNKGELVSIIHSVLTTVDNVTIGTNLNQIREFLKDE